MPNPVSIGINDFRESTERTINLAMRDTVVSVNNFRSNLFHIVPDKEYTRLKNCERDYNALLKEKENQK